MVYDALIKRFYMNFLGYAHCFMSIIISHMKDHSISVYQSRYATSIVDDYLDTATVKTVKKVIYYKKFTKADASTSDDQVEKLTREFNIHYGDCIGSLIYLLYTRVYLSFALQKLERFSSNTGKVHFEGLIHLLRYIRDNVTLGLNCYTDMKDSLLYDLLRQANIKNENQLMALSDYSWQDFPDTGRSTGACIIFYQDVPINHATHVPGQVSQSSTESDYNSACTAGMALAHFRVLLHEFLNRDPDIVPEEYPLIILDRNYDFCMAENGKDSKHNRHIFRGVHVVRNGEKLKMHKIDLCEGGMQLSDI